MLIPPGTCFTKMHVSNFSSYTAFMSTSGVFVSFESFAIEINGTYD